MHRPRRARPRASTARIGIAKAYTTRVGAGPLPTEIGGALEDADPRAGPRVRRLHRPPAPVRLVRRGGGALLRRASTGSTPWPSPSSTCSTRWPRSRSAPAIGSRARLLKEMPGRHDSCSRRASRCTRRCRAGRRRRRACATSPSCPRRRGATWSGCPSWRAARSASSPPAPTARDNLARQERRRVLVRLRRGP